MSDLKVNDPVVYLPIACDGHYRARVARVRGNGLVDIDVIEEEAGMKNNPLHLTSIAVVPTLKDLKPATCTRAVW